MHRTWLTSRSGGPTPCLLRRRGVPVRHDGGAVLAYDSQQVAQGGVTGVLVGQRPGQVGPVWSGLDPARIAFTPLDLFGEQPEPADVVGGLLLLDHVVHVAQGAQQVDGVVGARGRPAARQAHPRAQQGHG